LPPGEKTINRKGTKKKKKKEKKRALSRGTKTLPKNLKTESRNTPTTTNKTPRNFVFSAGAGEEVHPFREKTFTQSKDKFTSSFVGESTEFRKENANK